MEAALKCGNNHRLAARMRTDRDGLIKGKEDEEMKKTGGVQSERGPN